MLRGRQGLCVGAQIFASFFAKIKKKESNRVETNFTSETLKTRSRHLVIKGERQKRGREGGEFSWGKIPLKIVGMAVTHAREKSPLKPLFSPTLQWPQKMSQKASIQERPGLLSKLFLPLEEQLARGGFNSRGRGGEELNLRTQVSF